MVSEYVGAALVVEPDGDEVEVRASLRIEVDGWWGGDLIGPANWLGIAGNTEPFFELVLPDGRSGAAFVSELDGCGPISASRSPESERRRSAERVYPVNAATTGAVTGADGAVDGGVRLWRVAVTFSIAAPSAGVIVRRSPGAGAVALESVAAVPPDPMVTHP
jgi:hypothetical protein